MTNVVDFNAYSDIYLVVLILCNSISIDLISGNRHTVDN